MQGAEERRLRRISHTSQGGAIEGNEADDALMVDQGPVFSRLQQEVQLVTVFKTPDSPA